MKLHNYSIKARKLRLSKGSGRVRYSGYSPRREDKLKTKSEF